MKEIEKKFLVTGEGFSPPKDCVRHYIKQGYIRPKNPQIRVRIYIGTGSAFLTTKFKTDVEEMRDEFEDPIHIDHAYKLYDSCEFTLIKTRYIIPIDEVLKWEVDFYDEPHKGLVVAELERPRLDYPMPILPWWIGKEITDKKKYGNLYLAGYRD